VTTDRGARWESYAAAIAPLVILGAGLAAWSTFSRLAGGGFSNDFEWNWTMVIAGGLGAVAAGAMLWFASRGRALPMSVLVAAGLLPWAAGWFGWYADVNTFLDEPAGAYGFIVLFKAARARDVGTLVAGATLLGIALGTALAALGRRADDRRMVVGIPLGAIAAAPLWL